MFRGEATDRAVSETIGFVLVFSLVVSSVGIVYVVGFQGLTEARDGERVDNAERAFEVLAHSIEDLTRRGASSRATEIRVADAGIRAGQPVLINVTGDYDTDDPNSAEDFVTGNVSVTPIVYETTAGGDRVRYVNGAVLRGTDDGMAMREPPNVVVDDNRTVIPIVQTSVFGTKRIDGSTTVLVRTERTLSDVVIAERGTYDDVTVRMHTPNTDPWRRFLTAQGMTCSVPNEGTLRCNAEDVKRLSLVVYDVDVTFE
ncbi:DUF7289 family protein [Halorarum salinum]|uniref:Uncharacterized protein n=1 Tax=Halorarum salinum TaxID=2743089 RepID=A0A7D5QAZ8_9EURY|nr:hypothetical protein [Halobaculum salinum]QLG62797.1 hypothetical protein HUG12_14105 [Halobaculum salinum]